MATKKICDRCDAEISVEKIANILESFLETRPERRVKYDLCEECQGDFLNWLNPPRPG